MQAARSPCALWGAQHNSKPILGMSRPIKSLLAGMAGNLFWLTQHMFFKYLFYLFHFPIFSAPPPFFFLFLPKSHWMIHPWWLMRGHSGGGTGEGILKYRLMGWQVGVKKLTSLGWFFLAKTLAPDVTVGICLPRVVRLSDVILIWAKAKLLYNPLSCNPVAAASPSFSTLSLSHHLPPSLLQNCFSFSLWVDTS